MIEKNIVILGAGLSGISSAYHLENEDFIVLEKESTPGGICNSEEKDGFTFDQTGHWLHMRDQRTKDIFNKLFKDDFVEIERKTFVYSHNTFTNYPFQSNTYGLPPQVIKECVVGFIKAHYENDKSKADENFYEWCMAYLGEGISKHFMIPYNSKIYTVHPKKYASHWCNHYIPVPTIEEIVEGAVTSPKHKKVGYNATFKYPKKGGIGEFPKRFFEQTQKEKYLFNTFPTEIDTEKKIITLNTKEQIKYNYLINSIPLKDFLNLIKGSFENEAKKIAKKLKIASVSYLNVAFNKELNHKGHWFYIPEEKYMVYRLGSFSNIYPQLAPKGKSSAYIEFTHQEEFCNVEKFKQESIKLLLDMKLINSEKDIDFMNYRKIKSGYVIFNDSYFEDLEKFNNFAQKNDIIPIGRYGKWTYSAMENAILDGIEASQKIKNQKK